MDLYEILGCQRGAGIAEVKAGFRTRALSAHPDKVAGSGSKDVFDFASVYKAFRVLRDPVARAAYDAKQGLAAAAPMHAEPAAATQAATPPRSRADDFQSQGTARCVHALLAISEVGTLASRLRRLPCHVLEAIVKLISDVLGPVTSSGRAIEPDGTQRECQQLKLALGRTASPLSVQLTTPAGQPAAGACAGAPRGIYRLHGSKWFEAQVAIEGFLARWRGPEWCLCIRAHELLVGLKVGVRKRIREGAALEDAVRDVVAALVDGENDGWPLPFEWASVKTLHKRYHSPWFYDFEYALKAHQLIRDSVPLMGTEGAWDEYLRSTTQLVRASKPDMSSESLRRVRDEAEAAMDRRPLRGKQRPGCRSWRHLQPRGGPPRCRLQCKTAPTATAEYAAQGSGPPQRRLRRKTAPRQLRCETAPTAIAECAERAHPARSPHRPWKRMALTDIRRVSQALPLPWLPAYAEKTGVSQEETEEVLRSMAAHPGVERYLKRKFSEVKMRRQNLDARRLLPALEDLRSRGFNRVLQVGAPLHNFLWLHEICKAAPVSWAVRSWARECAPLFCERVCFRRDDFAPIRPPGSSSRFGGLRRQTGTTGLAAKRFLAFLGTWYAVHHTRHLELNAAPPEVKNAADLVRAFERLQVLESVSIGSSGWPDITAVRVLTQCLQRRAVSWRMR